MTRGFKQNTVPAGDEYQPACRLVSLLSASGDPKIIRNMALALGRKAASYGETVLILDAVDGALLRDAGVVYGRTLSDVANGTAEVSDALYVTSNEHFTAGAVGSQSLEQALGLLAALSLSYDWVFVVPQPGCTPAHVRLASASDVSILGYDTARDDFMRAYWMIDTVRRRSPKFDPLVLSSGEKCDAVETAMMLTDIVRDHLGAPPPYAGHHDDLHVATRLLSRLRHETEKTAVA